MCSQEENDNRDDAHPIFSTIVYRPTFSGPLLISNGPFDRANQPKKDSDEEDELKEVPREEPLPLRIFCNRLDIPHRAALLRVLGMMHAWQFLSYFGWRKCNFLSSTLLPLMLMLDSFLSASIPPLEVENATLAFWYLLFVLGGAGDVLKVCVGGHVAMRVYESGVSTLPFVQRVGVELLWCHITPLHRAISGLAL
jgi:hypothetical protein